MKVIYVAGPYTAYTHYGIQINIARAAETAVKCWKKGWAVVCPHLNVANFHIYYGKGFTESDIVEGCLELLERCDAVVMLPGWERSEGSKKEHEAAKKLGLLIFYGLDAVPRFNGGR